MDVRVNKRECEGTCTGPDGYALHVNSFRCRPFSAVGDFIFANYSLAANRDLLGPTTCY